MQTRMSVFRSEIKKCAESKVPELYELTEKDYRKRLNFFLNTKNYIYPVNDVSTFSSHYASFTTAHVFIRTKRC